ncbi:cyclase family protein [Cohnella lubricantis]|uniref:Cyclase family protein n=2 Tax=Cohnella lubricantis TaxID=2163172 RepID=A0A841T4V9_9BACL|nr:cyclase family protein [Cohnella lubricantis]MBB6676583.1 cyclase family protein [Cohnella lubricantis]
MRWIDLSRPIYSGMPAYPGDPEVSIEVAHTYAEHTWELRRMTLGTHAGTHVDAPSHMHPGAASLDELPVERFCGKARVVRADAPDEWPPNRGLFFAETAGIECAARLKELAPPFVGGGLSEELERALLGHGIITFTDLVELERIPPGVDFMFFGFPLRIAGGDGSPVRAVALLEEEGER